MLRRVKDRTQGHTNASAVANSPVLTYLKLAYYHVFAWAYAWCLKEADVMMVNSTWTANHVSHLVGRPVVSSAGSAAPIPAAGADADVDGNVVGGDGLRQRKGAVAGGTGGAASSPSVPVAAKAVTILYPPCDTGALAALPLEGRDSVILSLAQFRFVQPPSC